MKKEAIFNKINHILDFTKSFHDIFHQNYHLNGNEILSKIIDESNFPNIILNISKQGILDGLSKKRIMTFTTTSSSSSSSTSSSSLSSTTITIPKTSIDEDNKVDENNGDEDNNNLNKSDNLNNTENNQDVHEEKEENDGLSKTIETIQIIHQSEQQLQFIQNQQKYESPIPNCVPHEKYRGVWFNQLTSYYIAQVTNFIKFLFIFH